MILVFISLGTCSHRLPIFLNSARPRKLPEWIVLVRENFSVNEPASF